MMMVEVKVVILKVHDLYFKFRPNHNIWTHTTDSYNSKLIQSFLYDIYESGPLI